MPKKIFWDESKGTVYWLEEDGSVSFAPMSNDNTADLSHGGTVEVWSEDGPEAAKLEEARVRAVLGKTCGHSNWAMTTAGCLDCDKANRIR